jgi:phosphotransferase system HPr (HPr) family protein
MSQTIHLRDVILREEDFVPLLEQAAAPFGSMVAALAEDPTLLAQSGPVARLGEAADELETFLDDFGARENRTFVTFGELVASTRGLCRVRGVGLYLLSRLPRYQLLGDTSPLFADLQAADVVLDDALASLCGGLMEAAGKLGFTWSPTEVPLGPSPEVRRQLPRNLDADASSGERQRIAELGSRFQAMLKASRQLGLDRRRPAEGLCSYVAEHATEERCRWYESAVHNIQSMYDTYVLLTSVEEEHEWLRNLRGHVSVARHLLEMATGLVHFYERHENDIRHPVAKSEISRLVSKDAILDVAVNVCLRQAYQSVEGCAPVAQKIIEIFAGQQSVSLKMPDGVSLHARPLALIVQIARHHRTPLELTLEGESCSALSLMGLIMLAGKHPTPTSVEARGDARALADLLLLFDNGLGEKDDLPDELSYLRTTS